jgi:hypothetical protein
LAGATIGSAEPTPSTCGLNLDDPSVVAGSYSSARYDGIVLQSQLDYTNSKPWSGILPEGKVDYVLTTSIVNNTKSKIEGKFGTITPTTASPEIDMELKSSSFNPEVWAVFQCLPC